MNPNRALPQSKEALLKSYQVRLKDDVKSMLENFEGKRNLCMQRCPKIPPAYFPYSYAQFND